MAGPATNRVWTSLTNAEVAAMARAAEARGMRPSELARVALLAFLDQPVAQPPAVDATAVAPVLARLDALAATLGQHVAELGCLVPAAGDAAGERNDVRAALTDIAQAVGVLAGSLDPDDGGEAAFGPDRD